MSEENGKVKTGLEGILDHPRYTLRRELGRGSWGVVYEADDSATGETAALKVLSPNPAAKEKMRQRKLTPFQSMKNEGDLAACANIVPRSFEIDSTGVPFIRMPVYRTFLDQILGDHNGHRNFVGVGLNYEIVVGYLGDIAKGIKEMHQIRGRAHADIKPDNLALDSGRVLLSDLGNSTCVTLDWAEKDRSNMGFFYTRAPEQFSESSHPNTASDIWSFGALAYRMFTGEYPLEEELKNAKDPKALISQLGENGIDLLIKRKIKDNFSGKNKRIGKLIERCLSADFSKRPYSGYIGEHLERAVNDSLPKEIWRFFKKTAGWASAAAILGAASIGVAKIEDSEIKAPPPKVKGLLYLDNTPIEKGGMYFDAEQIDDLPKVLRGGFFIEGTTIYSKSSSTNRSVAYLVDCYAKTLLGGGGIRVFIHPSDQHHPRQIYDAVETEEERKERGGREPLLYDVLARSLEKTISDLREPNGRVDLEDVCTISLLGPETVNEAKSISGEDKFTSYLTARRTNGDYVIGAKYHDVLKAWLSHIHENN